MSIFSTQKFPITMRVFEEDTGRKQVGSGGSSGRGLVIIFWKEMANLGADDTKVKKKNSVKPQTAQKACSLGGWGIKKVQKVGVLHNLDVL